MISKEMENALNKQLNLELYSAYYYFSMAAYVENLRWEGMAGWFKLQAQEEVGHAMRFYGYINDVGGRVVLDKVDKPQTDYQSIEEIFQIGLSHEKHVTASIHKIVDQAISEKDHATKSFLDWFVTEQVEEEATMDKYLNKVKLIGDLPQGLFMLDAELGQRQAGSDD